MDNPKDKCMMDRRIGRVEKRLGEIEMWQVHHEDDHRSIWKEVAGTFNSGIECVRDEVKKQGEETQGALATIAAQIRKLFVLIDGPVKK